MSDRDELGCHVQNFDCVLQGNKECVLLSYRVK